MVTPLDLRALSRTNPQNGITEQLPALHPSWCAEVSFLCYTPPSFDPADSSLDPLWQEALEMIDADLHWLLQQPHQLFWCQCVFDASLHQLLDSYLRYAPRAHDVQEILPLKVCEVVRNVHRRVFMVFVRLATHKESQDSTLTKTGFADLIYENYLFDVPKLLDLCVLYGEGNPTLLAKMVASVFTSQPKYAEDWSITTSSILQMLQRVQEKVCGKNEGLQTDTNLTAEEFTDVITYIADIAITLLSFITIFPPATRDLMPCVEQIVLFYESVMPHLSCQWRVHKHSITSRAHFKLRLRQIKSDLASLVNTILHFQVDQDHTHKEEWSLDGFLATITAVLSEKEFMREFSKCYSLVQCVEQVQRSHPELPGTHFNYVLSALSSSEAPPPSNSMATGVSPEGGGEMESLVCRVQEVLPHLGRTFITACLREYGNNPDTVISSVLEGKLALPLQQLDWSAEGSEEKATSQHKGASHVKPVAKGTSSDKGVATKGAESMLEQRSGVFDGDEFDVFKSDRVNLSRVHIGKKADRSTISSLVDDKSHFEDTRQLYSPFTSEGGEGGEGGEREYLFDQYDDEYDDTYDSHNVGAQDTVSTDDLFTVHRWNEKGLYQKQFTVPSDEEDEEHTLETPKGAGLPVRGRGHAKGGQGEVRARQLKERHKGSHGNHNRKAMAERKRGKGMGPLTRN